MIAVEIFEINASLAAGTAVGHIPVIGDVFLEIGEPVIIRVLNIRPGAQQLFLAVGEPVAVSITIRIEDAVILGHRPGRIGAGVILIEIGGRGFPEVGGAAFRLPLAHSMGAPQ